MSNVIPSLPTKRITIINKLCPYTITEITPLNSVYLQSTKKRQQELENIETQERKLDYLETTKSAQEEYKMLIKNEEKINRTEDELVNNFKKQWVHFQTTGSL